MPKVKKLSARSAAIEILREMGGRGEIKAVSVEGAKRAKLGGNNPPATVASIMYNKAKKGDTFRVVERGVIELIESTPAEATEELTDESSPAVTPGSVVVKDASAAKPDPKPTPKKRTRKPKAAAAA